MPIYEYNCENCEKRFEALLKSQKDVPRQCPYCESKRIKKAFSTFNAAQSQRSSKPSSCSTCSTGSCPYSG